MAAINDKQLYIEVTQEVDSGTKDPALWAKAMTLAEGDEEKAKYRYITLRVEELSKAPAPPPFPEVWRSPHWLLKLKRQLRRRPPRPSLDKKLFRLCKNPDATPEAIAALLKAGDDIEARDKDGSTPLIWAAKFNSNLEITEALLEAALLKYPKSRYSQRYSDSFLNVVNRRDENRSTPLMWAAKSNTNLEIIEALLNAGADAKNKDMDKKTAADYAKENKNLYDTKTYWKLNDLQYE